MERFYGREHAIEVTNDEAELLLREWHVAAASRGSSPQLVGWLEQRLERRAYGGRAFRIAPCPEPIADSAALDTLAAILIEQVQRLAGGANRFLGRTIDRNERRRWLATTLDLLGFVNEARQRPIGDGAPTLAERDALDVMVRRMWARFAELSRRENYLFPDDPAYPAPALLLDYLDQVLALAEQDGRERRREWPFPKILWEREILLEKLGRFDELAATMRRSAALEGDQFKRATEDYLEVIAGTAA